MAQKLRAAANATGWPVEEGISGAGATSTWCRAPDPVVGCSDRRIRGGTGWRILEANAWEAADFPVDGWGGQLSVEGSAWSLLLVHSSISCNPVPLPASEAADWRRQLSDEESRHCEQARADAPALAKLIRGLWPG